jgi:hypothetical protein
MTVSKGRTDAERHAGRASVRNPATLAVLDLCGAGRRLCLWKTGLRPGLSRFRGQNAVVAPCRPEGTRSRPSMGGARALAESLRRTVGGRHRQRERRSPRREAPHAVRAGSRERLLKRFATAPTGDQDAAVSDRPRNRTPNPRMTREPAIPIPHGALEHKRQLVTATPSLDIDELVAHQPTERDRPRAPPVASATRERDDRDRHATTLELLPHSLASHQFTTSRPQPSRVRLRSLTTRRRLARIARQRLARRTAPRPPSAGHVQTRRRPATSVVRVPVPIPTARPRRRSAFRAPLIQPRATVAHRASSPQADGPGVVLQAASGAPGRPPTGTASRSFRAHPKGASSVQVGRCCLLNWASKRRFPHLPAQQNCRSLPAPRSETTRFAGLLGGGETGT